MRLCFHETFLQFLHHREDGLISESFSLGLKSLKMGAEL